LGRSSGCWREGRKLVMVQRSEWRKGGCRRGREKSTYEAVQDQPNLEQKRVSLVGASLTCNIPKQPNRQKSALITSKRQPSLRRRRQLPIFSRNLFLRDTEHRRHNRRHRYRRKNSARLLQIKPIHRTKRIRNDAKQHIQNRPTERYPQREEKHRRVLQEERKRTVAGRGDHDL